MIEQCEKRVFSNNSYFSHVCNKTAKFEVDGRFYCGIHNPNKAPTKAQIEAAENYEKQKAKRRVERAASDLLEALRGMLDQPDGPESYDAMIERALRAIAKATGGTA